MNGNDHEAFVLFGQNNFTLADMGNSNVDMCILNTSKGKMTIGVSGIDMETDEVKEKMIVKLGELSKKFLGKDALVTKVLESEKLAFLLSLNHSSSQ